MYYSTEYRTTMTVHTPYGELTDVALVFHITIEEYPAEPTSYGTSRGKDIEISATLTKAQLRDLTLFYKDLVLWIGQDEIKMLQDCASKEYENSYADVLS